MTIETARSLSRLMRLVGIGLLVVWSHARVYGHVAATVSLWTWVLFIIESHQRRLDSLEDSRERSRFKL